MTTMMKIALSPMTIFDGSLTVPEMIHAYNRFREEHCNMGHAITITRKRAVVGDVKYVVDKVAKNDGRIVVLFHEEYNDGTSYYRHGSPFCPPFSINSFFDWVYD